MFEYDWRESLEFQIQRVKRHFRADIAEAINRCGGVVCSKEWVLIEEKVDGFLDNVEHLRKEAASLPYEENRRKQPGTVALRTLQARRRA